ncbi:uncharacterized protein LOC108241875 [Kryptolebias marmoratus]|uniref:uncharacterized protein LOC108241875 n=1 Tax=Kryptolebias marmoratus TaxID=37003 RepID=UPI0007F8D1E1|nr:uncharacterized protein LOC108241875 [Kryptolebias marmoratus]
MLSFSQMFYQAGSRKRRYLQFMAKKVPPGKKATLAPNPCGATRWNSWFSAVQYHFEHFQLYTEFIEMEINVCGKSAPQLVERLNEMLHHTDVAQKLQVQINIMADKCKVILRLLDIFQSRCPATTKLYNYLEDLPMNFDASKTLQYEACAQYFVDHDLPLGTKKEILNAVEQAYNNAEDKLAKYMSHGQPGINVFKEVRVFDPRHLAFMSSTVSSYTAIPGFSAVPQKEMDTCFTQLGPTALRASTYGMMDLDVFWGGLQERLPVLSALARRYKNVIINSADAERSNSIYKLVLSSRRRSITNSHLKALVFLYHNQRLTSGDVLMRTLRSSYT